MEGEQKNYFVVFQVIHHDFRGLCGRGVPNGAGIGEVYFTGDHCLKHTSWVLPFPFEPHRCEEWYTSVRG